MIDISLEVMSESLALLGVLVIGGIRGVVGLLSKVGQGGPGAGEILGSSAVSIVVSIRGIYAIEDLVILGKQGWIPIIRLPFIFHPDKGSAWLGVVFWEAMVFTGDVAVNSLVSLGSSNLVRFWA